MSNPALKVQIADIKLKNPLFTASGVCSFGRELYDMGVLEHLGGIMLKGTTLSPRLGNNGTRVVETPAGMLNSVGLQNPGVEELVTKELPWLKALGLDLAVVCNISGNGPEDYARLAELLDGVPGVAALEVNISCPNVKAGGAVSGAYPHTAAEVTRAARTHTKLPLIVKLSPNVADIGDIAAAVEEAGADALSLINTLLGMAIDVDKRQPILGNKLGGLSGPAIRPVGVRMVYQVAQRVKIPLIGMGGIMSARDVLEYMMAGASAVAVGTGLLVNPLLPLQILQDLEEWLLKEGVRNINEIIGAALPK